MKDPALMPDDDSLLYTDKKTYVFVRTAKTASTTIIRSLAKFNKEAPLGYWFNSEKKYLDRKKEQFLENII